MKLHAARFLLLLATLALCVVGAEWALRLLSYGDVTPPGRQGSLRVPHPSRGWALEPNGRAERRTPDFDVVVETNSHGQRDREHRLEKPPGVHRIVVLGDSFMEAYQVDLADALPYRLQEAFAERGVEVVNLGVGGYGTAQQLRALEEQGLRFQPDLVLLAFFTGNDIQNNHPVLQAAISGGDDRKVWGRPFAETAGLEAPLVWTEPDYARMQQRARDLAIREASFRRRAWKLVQPKLLEDRVSRALAGVAGRLGKVPADPQAHFGWAFLAGYESPDWDEAWLITRRLLLAVRDRSAAAGASFAVLIVPSKLQVEPEFRDRASGQYGGLRFDETHVNRMLASFLAEHGIPLIDPTPRLAREHAAGRRVYHQIADHHWNRDGHRVVTEVLREALDRAGLVPPAPQPGRGAPGGATGAARRTPGPSAG